MMNAVAVPEHLTPRMQDLWKRIVSEFEFGPHEFELLRLALEALDRCEQARAVLAEEGALTTDRYGGRRVHPAIAVERDSRIAAARLLRELGLDNAEAA